MPNSNATARLAPLTGLRFVAAFAVLLFHTAPAGLRVGIAGALISRGYMGVSAFFVLSGFILTYNYTADGAPLDRRAFWAARVARIYPVYLLGLVVAFPHFVFATVREGEGGAGAIAAVTASTATLLQAWVPSLSCRLNCPGWSLSVEAFFYLVFPLIALVIVRLPWWRLVAIAIAAWIAALGVMLALVRLYPTELAANPDGLWHLPIVRLPEFVLGIALGRLYMVRVRDHDAARRVPWGAIAVCASLGAAAIAAYARGPLLGYLPSGGAPALAFGALILALAAGGGALGRVLAHPALVRLGEASYALYILHVPLFQWWTSMSRYAPTLDTETWLGNAAYVATVLAASLLVLRYVEEPARRRLRLALARGQATATPAPATDSRAA